MIKHSPRTALTSSLFCFAICLISIVMLFSTNMLNFFNHQVIHNYQVIYLDAKYSGFIGSSIVTLSGALFMLWQYICLKRSNESLNAKHQSVKVLTIVVIIGFLFIFPGQSLEKSRLESRAEEEGYQACPPFTLLISSVSIDAWVKDFELCNDPEVGKLARYGYPEEPEKIAKLLSKRKLEKALTNY
ncbi:hypothetical protein ACRRS0_09780 [Agarivorans sp. QJM3NY_29]|uniref:hypothetical protein n=1 Tax=unclassified Agarivorans TaxID=2636026 RepID=UPI003D7E6740